MAPSWEDAMWSRAPQSIARWSPQGLAVLVAIILIPAIILFLPGWLQERRNSFQVDLTVTRGLAPALPEALGKEIKNLPGVKAVFPLLRCTISFEEQGLLGVPCLGLIPETDVFGHMIIRNGRHLKPDDKRAVLLGVDLARQMNKNIGDNLEVADERCDIVGILESTNANENRAIFMPLTEMQGLLDRERTVTEFNIVLTRPGDEALIKEIQTRIEGLSNRDVVVQRRH